MFRYFVLLIAFIIIYTFTLKPMENAVCCMVAMDVYSKLQVIMNQGKGFEK